MDLGFERAGLVCKWQVEINDYANRVLQKHWPNVRRGRDVHEWPAEDVETVDVICGGDPCQANSAAVGSGDAINASLGGEFVRIVAELRPRIVVRENPTFVRKDAPWPWWRMRSELESIGYAVLPFRLRSCCFGAFHQRDRMFLLAELADANRERLEGGKAEAEGGNPSEPTRRVHADDWMALSASRGFGKRNQVPNFVERMRGIGNAVDPVVAEWIGKQIVKGASCQAAESE